MNGSTESPKKAQAQRFEQALADLTDYAKDKKQENPIVFEAQRSALEILSNLNLLWNILRFRQFLRRETVAHGVHDRVHAAKLRIAVF
jgi:hypothetical protein